MIITSINGQFCHLKSRNSPVSFSLNMAKTKRRRDTPASYSSVSTNNLPMDLITDILVRSPVKSLIRFKSVSKSWNSLIQSPNFIKLHLKFSKLNPHPIFSSILTVHDHLTATYGYVLRLNQIDSPYKPINIDFPSMPGRSCRLLGISNGLICFMLGSDYYCDIVVSNPVTGSYRKIPPFELEVSSWCNGDSFYGFNSDDNGFELIGISCLSSGVKVSQFSSSAGVWKDIEVKLGNHERFVSLRRVFRDRVPVYKDGVFYWEGFHGGVGYLLIFDVFNKVMDEIAVSYRVRFGLLEFREQLVVFHLGNKRIDLWTLNENDKTWKMFKSIDVGDSIPGYGIVTVVGRTGNGKLVLRYGEDIIPNLYLYDIETNDISSLPIVNVEGRNGMFLFAESLAAVYTDDIGDEV